MDELNAAERAHADVLGQKLFDWERLTEEHCAVLRADPNAYAEAYQQYAVKAPQIDTVPPRDQYEEHILLGERNLEKECVSFLDHVEAVNTLAHIYRLQMALVSELRDPVQKAVMQYLAAKHASHQYAPSHTVIPKDPSPALRELFELGTNVPTAPAPAPPPFAAEDDIDYPAVLPAKPFSRSDIAQSTRMPVSAAEVAHYKLHPETLIELIFAATGGDMEGEVFKISCLLITGNDKLFYLVFTDEGADAFAYSSSGFFHLLESSERVITEGSQ